MRVKILRRKDTGTVVLVYPSTLDEHRQALETLGRGARPAAGHDGLAMGRTESGPPQGCYVVTTEEQRRRWGLPDLAACGLARVVNESRALELLYEPGDWSAAAELLADAEAVPALVRRRTRHVGTRGRARARRARTARRSGARGAGERRSAAIRLRDAAARTAGVGRVRDRGSRGSAGPCGDGRRPAVADARARTVQPGPPEADGGPHPRWPRPRQDPAHRSARGKPADRRRAHRGGSAPRQGNGDRIVGARRAPTHVRGRGARPVPGRAPGDRQDVTGRGRRRGARPQPRARGARRAPHRASDPREGRRRPRTHRPGPARGRGEKPGLHPRAARRGETRGRRRTARCPRPGRRLGIPGPVPPVAVRSVGSPVDHDGGRSEGDSQADARSVGSDRAAGLHRAGEAGHRRTVPAEAARSR